MLRGSKLVALMVACSATLSVASACIARAPRPNMVGDEPLIQVRLARHSAAPGFVQARWLTGDSVAYVAEELILADEGITHVGVHPAPEGLILCFYLTDVGGARLQQGTGQAIGRQLAMMIASRIVSMAPIMSGIGSSRRFGGGAFASRDVSDELAAKITAKWPQRSGEPNCTNIVAPPPTGP